MGLRVAVTGSDTFFGRDLVRALDADPAVAFVLALDVKAPDARLEKTTWARLDLVHPGAGDQLANKLREHAIEAVVHTAFLARPSHRGGWAHELEAIGTRSMLAAVEATGVQKLILRSSTLAYGARPTHPNHLKESAPLEGASHSAFIADKVEAEAQVARFAQKHPGRVVTILRLAPLLGDGADTLATLYLQQRVCPTLLGFDPLVQLLHSDDAVESTRRALHRDVRGAVNVGAPGVLPLSQAIRLAGARALPLPATLVRKWSETMWTFQLGHFPPGLVDFLRYLCVADLSRMREELGFQPRFGIQDAIRSLAGHNRPGNLSA